MCQRGKGQGLRILFDFLQIGQTVSPQSVPTTNLEVKNGVNCEHSPVDLSKVSGDMGSWLIGLRVSLVEPRVSFGISAPFSQDQSPLCRKGGPSALVFFLLLQPQWGWLISLFHQVHQVQRAETETCHRQPSLTQTSSFFQIYFGTCSLAAPSCLQKFCQNNVFATIF